MTPLLSVNMNEHRHGALRRTRTVQGQLLASHLLIEPLRPVWEKVVSQQPMEDVDESAALI